MISSKPKLANELDLIKKTLLKNGKPKDLITNTIKYKCLQFSIKPKFGPERCQVYLRLPWISNTSMELIEQSQRSINCCFNLVKLRFVLNKKKSPNLKNSVTTFQKSYLIYWFTCKWGVCYIGCTSQRIEIRINQHIPLSIPNT